MNKKLTLMLDGETIQRAKLYAQQHHASVSVLVERYFKALSSETKSSRAPLTKQLSGIIKIPKGFDEKADYRKSRIKKYQ